MGADDTVRCAVLRGEGAGFSGGGDLALVQDMAGDFEVRTRVWKEARDLVYNVINCDKPIVSAHPRAGGGRRAGGGAAGRHLGRGQDAKIVDGHTRLGVAAGDHAAIVWPLLCGMAKAKYYLMLCEPVSGEEAERIGLVSLAVDEDQLLPQGLRDRRPAGAGSQSAIRWTKYSLNNWLRQAGPGLRHLAGAGIHGLRRPGRAGRHRVAARAAPPEVLSGRRHEPRLIARRMKTDFSSALAGARSPPVRLRPGRRRLPKVEGAWVRSSRARPAGHRRLHEAHRQRAAAAGRRGDAGGRRGRSARDEDGRRRHEDARRGELDLPAGQTVELKPGGYHLMLMDLKQPLAAGTHACR